MADIQLMQCKNQQKTPTNSRNIVPYKKIGVTETNADVRILTGSLPMAVLCACAVKIWLKVALNAVKLPQFEAVNRKSWLPRTMVVNDIRQRSRLTWFCTCADSYVIFNTGPYTVLADNSICLNHGAMCTTCIVNRQTGLSGFKHVGMG